MRDAFAVLFFVSVGMLLDPRQIVEAPLLIAGTLAVVMIGKPLVALVIVRLMRYPFRVALSVSVALAQIGEFSFILASVGRELGLLGTDATNTLVTAAMTSIVANPLLYRAIPAVERWASARPALWRILDPRSVEAHGVETPAVPDPRHRAIVIGYGPTGRTVTRLLQDNGIAPTVVELNIDTVRQLKEDGIATVYGDATKRETLAGAGIANAGHLIHTSSIESAEIIRTAREINPSINVLARATYLRDLDSLRAAGANEVFSGEGEVALALTTAILKRLGATDEQIDRERARSHRTLFGAATTKPRPAPSSVAEKAS